MSNLLEAFEKKQIEKSIIGLTVVALGTSIPELFVSINAAIKTANPHAIVIKIHLGSFPPSVLFKETLETTPAPNTIRIQVPNTSAINGVIYYNLMLKL